MSDLPRTAFLTGRPTKRPLRQATDGPVGCNQTGVGRAIGAVVYRGAILDEQAEWELRQFDIVVLNMYEDVGPLALDLAKIVRKLVVFQEGSGAFWNWPSPHRSDFIRALRAASLVLVQNPALISLWRHFTNRPVDYLLYPFPAEAEQYRLPYVKRTNTALACYSTTSQRGGLLSLAIARSALPEDEWHLKCICHQERDIVAAGRLRALFVANQIRRLPYEQYMRRVASARIVVNLDPCFSLGRMAADCAAVGVPCVGYRTSMFQSWLWPELSCMEGHEKGIDAWVSGLARNRDYYDQIVSVADIRKQEFTAERVRQRFLEAIRCL